jgi:hypothetical protein
VELIEGAKQERILNKPIKRALEKIPTHQGLNDKYLK